MIIDSYVMTTTRGSTELITGTHFHILLLSGAYFKHNLFTDPGGGLDLTGWGPNFSSHVSGNSDIACSQ